MPVEVKVDQVAPEKFRVACPDRDEDAEQGGFEGQGEGRGGEGREGGREGGRGGDGGGRQVKAAKEGEEVEAEAWVLFPEQMLEDHRGRQGPSSFLLFPPHHFLLRHPPLSHPFLHHPHQQRLGQRQNHAL
jgi:hypothetical protein